MSDANVDELIDELFPEQRQDQHRSYDSSGPAPTQRQSEWDDDDTDDDRANHHSSLEMRPMPRAPPKSPPTPSTTNASAHAALNIAGGHDFDNDSSSEDCDVRGDRLQPLSHESAPLTRHTKSGPSFERSEKGSGKTTLRRGISSVTLHPVPFPSLANCESGFACAPRCYLTNLAAALMRGSTHPTLEQLRSLGEDERVLSTATRQQAMLAKGAFYCSNARLGNGSLDHHGDASNPGGCTHILCRKCNYMVVRLQGASWVDGGGHVNLYLTLRNYYPDWCRLACATPVGMEDDAASSCYVLEADSSAAAYCCQCSWVTVRTAKAVMETKLTDGFLMKSEEDGSHPFATELPPPVGEHRRPPLWVCHGHPQ